MSKVLIGNIRGPEGPEGPQGLQGEKGLDGANVLPTSAAVAQAVREPGEARTELLTTFARTSFVRDIREFLLPGETLDRTGATSVHVIFQRAIDALNAFYVAQVPVFGKKIGYQIEVPAGTYGVTTGLTWRSGVGLRGAGQSESALVPIGRVCAINGWAAPGAWDGVSYEDCYFQDITIDCSRQSHTAYDFSVKGMFIQHMRRAKFERVTIRDAWATGFGVDFLEDSWFIDCTAVNCGRGVPSSRFGTGAGFGIGCGYSDVESVTIMNCVSVNNYTHGYFIEHLDRPEARFYSKGFKLIGCTGSGNWDGFLDAGGCGALVQGNVFTDNLYAGVMLRGTGTGMQGGVDGLVADNFISGNGASSGAGVMLLDCSAGGYTFRGNEIVSNKGPGVWAPATSKIGAGLRIIDNHVADNAGIGILTESPSIVRLTVSRNTVERNGGDGIKLASSLGRPVIKDNQSHRNRGYGLWLAGANFTATPRISGNSLTNNSDNGYQNDHTVDVSTYITDNLTDTVSIVVGANQLADPSFESNITGVTNTNAPISRPSVGSAAHSGSYVMRGTVTAAGTAYSAASAAATFTAGDYVRGRIWVKAVAGRTIYPTLNLGPSGGQIVGAKVTATGAWQLLEVGGVLPTGKTTARIAVNVQTDAAITAGEVVDVDDVELATVTGMVANLLSDPSFETTSSGTTSLNATISRPNVGADAHSGDYVLRGTYNGAGGTGYGLTTATGTVAQGDLVRGRAWVKAVAGRKVYLSLNLGTGGGQIIGPKVLATGQWQELEFSGVIPAGKTTCRVAAYVDTDTANTTGEVLEMDDVELIKIV